MNSGSIVVVVLIVAFALIILAIILLKRHTKLFKKDEKPDDQTITKQELNRVLEDVDDEETKKAMDEYHKTHQVNEEKANEEKHNDKEQ